MQRNSLSFLIIFLAGFAFVSCNNPQNTATAKDKVSTSGEGSFNLDSVKAIINQKNKAFAKAFVTGDSAAMVNNYTVDAKLFPPNEDKVEGRDAIAKLISQYLKYGIKEFSDSTTAVYGNADNVVEEGTLFMGDGKGNTIDKGKYVEVWRKVDGDWKLYTDIWNTSLPPAASKK
jgi:ketosteroid isomerase-like protein